MLVQTSSGPRRRGKFKLDFSGLKRQHTSARGGKERDSLDSDFKTEIEEREKALSRAAPNLKALQQFEAVKVSLINSIMPESPAAD